MRSSGIYSRVLDDCVCFFGAAVLSFMAVFGAANACGQAATANKARDLAREVQRAAYLSEIHDKSDREVLAMINHKLDLLLDLHRIRIGPRPTNR